MNFCFCYRLYIYLIKISIINLQIATNAAIAPIIIENVFMKEFC